MAKDESSKFKTTSQQAKKRQGKPGASGGESSLPVKPNNDVYIKVVKHEEALAESRDADEDSRSYIQTCKEICQLLQEIAEWKTKSSEVAANEIKERQIQITIKIMLLKKLNRLEKVRTKNCRQALQNYREQVDSDNLHLQNLVYEQLHLSKEVIKCHEFKSVDEDMDLVSIDEFYATAPEEVSKPNETKDNPHNLKLARLSWELIQRKDLSSKLKKLEADKENVAKEIDAKKDQLSNLEPHLKAVLDSTKHLQETLGIPIDKTKKLHELALLLPKPLYVLFVQAEAYGRIVKWLNVNIGGRADEVNAPVDHFDDISSADSDSDECEPTRRRKVVSQDRRKSGGSGVGDSADQRRLDCLKKHPLSVELKISLRAGHSITLQFQWLSALEVVCVLPLVSITGNVGLAAADLLAPTAILSSLFPGDVGETCPNPSSYYLLQRASIQSFPTNIPNLGIPYQWAQTLCGISYISDALSVSVESSRRSLQATLQAIHFRLKNRIALANEVKLLEVGECLKDKNLQARLGSFTALTVGDLQRVPTASRLLDKAVIDNTYIAYRGSIDINEVKITAYIMLAPSYPLSLPIFAIEVLKKKLFNSANSDHIRDLEREMNVVIEEDLGTGDILLLQMQKLLRCCEILVATEFTSDRPVKANFFRSVSGRSRNHPYRFNTTAGGIFTHRTD